MPRSCIQCDRSPARHGLLCSACRQRLSTSPHLLPEHIQSDGEWDNARAWLIDSWGRPHPLSGDRIALGRLASSQLFIGDASVSRRHAVLSGSGTHWSVRDLRSRNGTFIDNQPVHRSALLSHRSCLLVGEVPFYYCISEHELPTIEVAPEATQEHVRVGGFHCSIQSPHLRQQSVWLVADTDDDPERAGGRLVFRSADTQPSEMRLTPLNFQLLKNLCERQLQTPTLRRSSACVSARSLAQRLPFRSPRADEEDVRQRIRRLRQLLRQANINELIQANPPHGYYVAWPVSAAA